MWGSKNDAWSQTLNWIFGIGALTGPLIAVPFLSSTARAEYPVILLNSTPSFENTSVMYNNHNDTDASRMVHFQPIVTTEVSPGNFSNANDTLFVLKPEFHWPYTITGICLCFSSALLFALALFCSRISLDLPNIKIQWKFPKLGFINTQTDLRRKERKCQMTLMAILFLFHLTCCIVELNFASYLSIYVVEHLGWSEQEGAQLTSHYWTAITIGRILAYATFKVLEVIHFLFVL